MEPLSPKSANIQLRRARDQVKLNEPDEAKVLEAAKKAHKEKEYAAPPPQWVMQPPLRAGYPVRRYRSGRLLGKGGFAVAYEGELESLTSGLKGQVFALKIVKSRMNVKKMEEKVSTGKCLSFNSSQFRTELQIHAKMSHPNIVEFHRAFSYGDSTYVVLELCPNGSVMDMVKKRKCLSLPETRRLMVQLCGAMKYMHARNTIHRDLKMGNLFLDAKMNLKIGDFGLAAVLVSKDEFDGLFNAKSRRTTLCGTPNYIAPEILEKGKGGHDHKVDIWAMGIIL